MNRSLRVLCFSFLAILSIAIPAYAVEYDWIASVPGDSYNTVLDWSGGVLPVAGDWMFQNNAANWMLINDNYLGASNPDYLYVGRNYSTHTGTGEVHQTGGTFTLNGGIRGIGRGGGTGTYIMTGGTLNLKGAGTDTPLLIGADAGSVGLMSISDSTVNVAGIAKIGDAGGTGTLTVNTTTGSLTSANVTLGRLWVGTGAGSNGTATVTGNGTMVTINQGSFTGLDIGDGAAGTSGELTLGLADHTDNPTIRLVNTGLWGNGWLRCGNGAGASGTVTVNSGLLDLSGDLSYDDRGTLDIGANASTGIFTQTGGTVITNKGGTNVGEKDGSIATLNLNGGVFKTTQIRPSPWEDTSGVSSTVNFNGSTLVALADNSAFVRAGNGTFTANVLEDGAKIDSGIYSVGLGVPLVHAGVASTDGGLTKLGSGNLTLSAAGNSYTGNTVVQAGQLTLATGTDTAPLLNFVTTNQIVVRPGAAVASDVNSYATSTSIPLNADITFDAKSIYSVAVIPTTGAVIPLSVQKISAGAGSGPVVVNLAGIDPAVGVTAGTVLYFTDGTSAPSFIPGVDSVGQSDVSISKTTTTVELQTVGMVGSRGWQSGTWGAGSWKEVTVPGKYTGTPPASSADKAWFDSALSGGSAGPVTLDIPVVLSSMLFTASTGQYTITPATGTQATNTITLSSSIAANAQIQVLAGAHAIDANIKMAAGDPIISVVPGQSLALNGVLSDLVSGQPASITLNSSGAVTGAEYDGGIATTQGTLTLNGANTFTGSIVMKGFGRLELGNPGALGAGSGNLVLNGYLAYTGTASTPTTVSTARGITFEAGKATHGTNLVDGYFDYIDVPQNINLQFNGQTMYGAGTAGLRKSGPGALIFSNSGLNELPRADIDIGEGTLVLENGTFNKDQVNIDIQNNYGDLAVADVGSKTATLVLQNGVKLISRGELNVGRWGGTGYLTVSGGSNFTNTWSSMFIGRDTGTGTLAISGNSIVNSGYLAIGDNSTGSVSVASGSSLIVMNDNIDLGRNNDQMIGNGTLTTSGTISLANGHIFIGGNGGNGNWTQSGGSTTLNNTVYLGEWDSDVAPGVGILNLNGGVLSCNNIQYSYWRDLNAGGSQTDPATVLSTQTVNFDGGTLRALVDDGNFIDFKGSPNGKVFIKDNGATIDSNGKNVTIQVPIETGSTGIDGGLKKIGAGTLTLNGAVSYTGNTIVDQGVLAANTGINTPSSTVYVATGATLNASSIVADSLVIGGGPYAAAATAAVPEPCTFVLLALAGLGALLVWRRK